MAHGRIQVLVVAVGVMVPALVTSAAGATSEEVGDAQSASAVAESPRVGHNFRISRSSADEGESALVYNDTDNEFLAVWTDSRREETRGSDIFGQRLTPDGERIGRAFRISGWAASNDQRQPAVAYNSVDNEYLVVWADLRKQDTRGWEIYGQRVSADGQRLGHNVRLSGLNAVRDEWRPTVAYGSADNGYVVFWIDSRRRNSPGSDVFGQLVNANGKRVGHNFGIASTVSADDPEDWHFIPKGGPAVAYNSVRSEFLVAWSDRREAATTGTTQVKAIYGQRVLSDGHQPDDGFRISGLTSSDRWPAIAHDPTTDQYLVVWVSDRANDYSTLFGQRVTGNGERDGETFSITDGDAFHVKTPAVTHDAAHGHYLAVWQDDRYQVWPNRTRFPGVFGQFITTAGERHGDNFPLPGVASRGAHEPALTYNTTERQHLAVWTDWRNRKTRGTDIYGQLLVGANL